MGGEGLTTSELLLASRNASGEAPDQPHASRLRRDATEAEQRLWSRLRNRGLSGYKFKRQHTIGPYIADFVCLERKLIVEVDGSQHNEQVDRARTDYLRQRGFRVIRYWNNDVLQETDGVLISLLAILEGG